MATSSLIFLHQLIPHENLFCKLAKLIFHQGI